MINTVFTIKKTLSQDFTQEGKRVPVSILETLSAQVVQIKTKSKDGYCALQLALGQKTRPSRKSLTNHLKGAKLNKDPLYLREVKIDNDESFELGQIISPDAILKPGDFINVTAVSKGTGFTGVVKRWHFAGGPRTHGQSDRPRSPGSIGQGTSPGRVWKGKKMAGHSGHALAVIKNLQVIKIDSEKGLIYLKGQVPGARGELVILSRSYLPNRQIVLLDPGAKIGKEAQVTTPASPPSRPEKKDADKSGTTSETSKETPKEEVQE